MGKPRPNRLRVWRADRRITQMRLGQKSGVSPTRISFIENRLHEATPDEQKALAKALDVDVATIFPPLDEARAS